MRILLLSHMRIGDLLQTQPLISDLHRLGHRVAISCLPPFHGITSLLRYVECVFSFPGDAILPALESGNTTEDGFDAWPVALEILYKWREDVCARFPYDLVCNLTPVLNSALLTKFLADGRNAASAGFVMDPDNVFFPSSLAGMFIYSSGEYRRSSPFNLVDLMRHVGLDALGLAPGSIVLSGQPGENVLLHPRRQLLDGAAARLKRLAPADRSGFVAFQLGASEEKRRWPVPSFVELGRRLWTEKKLCPVLLGSNPEQKLAVEFAALADYPFVDLVGNTSLEEVAAVLFLSQLLITNDTGTMHLAAGLERPVLAIFLATAQPFDTGPYFVGSCSVEPNLACHPCSFDSRCPNDFICNRTITPEIIGNLALGYLSSGRWRYSASEEAVRIWITRTDSLLGNNYMALHSLSGHEASERFKWLTFLRFCLRRYFDRQEQEFTDEPMVSFDLSPETKAGLGAELDVVLATLELLRIQGEMLTQKPIRQITEKFLTSLDRCQEFLWDSKWLHMFGLLYEKHDVQMDFLQGLNSLNRLERLFRWMRRLVE